MRPFVGSARTDGGADPEQAPRLRPSFSPRSPSQLVSGASREVERGHGGGAPGEKKPSQSYSPSTSHRPAIRSSTTRYVPPSLSETS